MSPFIGHTYHAHGKLLLTGEYFVLDGAMALALPTRSGQRFHIEAGEANVLNWISYDADGSNWFHAYYRVPDLDLLESSAQETAQRLQQILKMAFSLTNLPSTYLGGCTITTSLEFSRHWGLGTSSTLISFLADLLNIDPYQLLDKTFGGSGYDLACAQASGPILYQNRNASRIDFYPSFADQLYFVYLGKKQDSREGIQRYRALGESRKNKIPKVNQLTQEFMECQTLPDFEQLMVEHERLVADTLDLPRAQELYFEDYWGQVKSLGAWGGDFVLVSSGQSMAATKAYFASKHCNVIFRFNEISHR